MIEYPLTDDYLAYNYTAHRYVLTLKDVEENLAIDLTARIKNANAINSLLERISVQIYAFIHSHNHQNDLQDYIIAKTEKGRDIIKRAMEEQLIYFLTVGDLSRSTDLNKRALAIDETAKNILLETIPQIRTSICYTGNFFNQVVFTNLSDTQW